MTMYHPRRIRCGLFTLALLASSGCKDAPADAEGGTDGDVEGVEAPSTLSLPVVGEEVRQGDLVLSVLTTGQVRSEANATLKAEVAGQVVEVLVTPGTRVRKGQPLVRLDTRMLDIAVQEAEANVAKADLALLDNTVPDSIVTGRAITGERLKNARTRAGIDEAKARLDRAKLERERAVIVAPFDGVMDGVHVAPGERVSVGTEIAIVVDLDNLRIEAAVLEHDLPFITIGGEAVVTTAAAPNLPVRGRVAAVLPLVDSTTRAGRALIRVRGNNLLRPGMYADVRLEANRLTDRTVVPARAIIERDGRPLVFVVKDGRAQWVYIVPGRTNGRETEVLPDSSSGVIPISAGDIVLVEGHLTLTHDAPVRVVSAAERREP